MTTTFWLIRHGETNTVGQIISGRLPGVHLNPNGRRQAEMLEPALARVPLGSIYSSPLERAMETAQPLARARSLSVLPCEAANEVDFGEWSGKPWSELERLPEWRRFNTFRSGTPAPGGELMLEVQARIVRELECLRRRHPDQHVAIVTHADVIRSALAHYAAIPVDLFQRIEISPASFSTLALEAGGAQILRVNGTVEL